MGVEPVFTVTVLEPNDLSDAPASSFPLEFDYNITDQSGNRVVVTGVTIGAGESNVTVTPSASAAVPSPLQDGLLTLSIVMRDAAGNAPLVVAVADTMIRGA